MARRRKIPPTLCRLVLALSLAGSLPMAVQADRNPYYVGARLGVSHENNLLRLADRRSAPEGLSKSDTVLSTALLAGLDQPIGRQRLFGNVTLRDNRYSRNTVYNNHSYAAQVGLDWSTIERLSGSLSASSSRSLSSFNLLEVGLLNRKNEETVDSLGGSVRLGLVSQYALEATASHRRVRNSIDDDRLRARNHTQDSVSLGGIWRPTGATRIGLAWRETRGEYPQFLRLPGGGFEADRYKRQDIDLTGSLQPTGASTLDLRLSSGRTRYDLATQRDFSGLTGSVGWTWQAGARTRVSTRLVRETGQESYAYAPVIDSLDTVDYSRVSTSLRTRVDYALTAKIGLNASLSLMDRDLVRTLPGLFGDITDTGRERYTMLSLGAIWRPTRSVSVGCDIGTQQRDGSGRLGSDLRSGSFGCFGQLMLQ